MPSETRQQDVELIKGILADRFDHKGDISCNRLGGLTNFNYHVKAGNLQAVFRIPGDGTEDLVDRKVEGALTRAASELGVDSELLYYDNETGVKAMRLIPHANTMSKEKLQQPENLIRAAQLMRKLHDGGKEVDFRFDVFDMIPHYEDLIELYETIDWQGYAELRQKLMALHDDMQARNLAMCHCDPLCENFVLDEETGRMYLVDWEYGGMNDPLWDVADVIIECDYNPEQRSLFEESYFGRPATAEEEKLISANIVLIDFLWALWGKQRAHFDNSLGNYGPARFERAWRNYKELLG